MRSSSRASALETSCGMPRLWGSFRRRDSVGLRPCYRRRNRRATSGSAPSATPAGREVEAIITVPASTAAKIRLHNAMLDKSIQRSQLAGLLSQSDEYVHEVLDTRRATYTAHVDDAIEVIGGTAPPAQMGPHIRAAATLPPSGSPQQSNQPGPAGRQSSRSRRSTCSCTKSWTSSVTPGNFEVDSQQKVADSPRLQVNPRLATRTQPPSIPSSTN